ncbi:MAG: DUF2961 domain-containing protein [Clostridia bacterium]|nr:DUF2961 domain-containing protein [Clostridia bacterium]
MFNGLVSNLSDLSRLSNAQSRSISPENFTGEKGKGGMATEGTGKNCARDLGQKWKVSPSIQIKAGDTVTLANIDGCGAITHIWLTQTGELRNHIIRMYWDGSDVPSVECPIGDFFANPSGDVNLRINSLAVCVNPANGFNCYWQMPFRKNARITVENRTHEDSILYYQIDYTLTELSDEYGYFHAQFRRQNPVPYMEDFTILDGVQGKGQYIGTYMLWGANNNGWWGEGEIKFFMDGDTEFPTICGTGTEDYFCGAYGFEVKAVPTAYSTAYAGFDWLEKRGPWDTQSRYNLYRWHLTDPIRFENDLKVTIQALGWRSGGRYLPLQEDLSSVAFWYQDKPAASMPAFPDKDYTELR